MKINKMHWEGRVLSKLMGCVLSPIFGVLVSGEACASKPLMLDDISNSYSNCSYRDNGNGSSTVSVDISYKAADGHVGLAGFQGRGIMLYKYDKNGNAMLGSTPAYWLYMNGTSYGQTLPYSTYSMYLGYEYSWWNRDPFVARVVATMYTKELSAWPAISVRAANRYAEHGNIQTNVAEIKGAAYISTTASNNGSCKVITNPETSPPLDINISVSAPDWNLGDLQQGQSDTTFSRSDQQLCFSYSAADVQGEKFIISARNANGVVNNRYRLRHLSDTSQTVPYRLTLDSGGTRLQLPNNGTALPLNGGNRTCFVPTFRTEVGKTVKEGDYNDVLTFTVTTKS
ncbi:hypothetical protein ACIPIN_00535 [Pseudomonas sp. NPDC087697]|uniref:hypothetical protein n=1 Tax=Pseudomonas sp. NPDC087697 TaxID=3364447 RepID=UPI0037F5FE9B